MYIAYISSHSVNTDIIDLLKIYFRKNVLDKTNSKYNQKE